MCSLRTNLNTDEIINVARAIAGLEYEPNLRYIPDSMKALITGWDDEFTMSYRKSNGITQFFTSHHSDDSYNKNWLTRDLLKTLGTWNSAVAYVFSKVLSEYTETNSFELFQNEIDLANLLDMDGGFVVLSKDIETGDTLVHLKYECGLEVDLTVQKFLEMFLH